MISFASPIFTNTSSPPPSPQNESPTSARSRRIAILPEPASQPASPPIPVRSPLRPTPRGADKKPAPDPALSKRKHALIELLSSERAYASDLALIRDIHIPLALGHPAPFPTSPPTSPATPPPSPLGPPMTKDDTRIIFGNVEELAVFSEVFCDKLEEALHGVLDPDGNGEDQVADLFLSIISHLKPPYTTYITRHPAAVAHLNALPQTPALAAYLAQTHTLAQSYTHAWDLPSLLIKPVQRLLKYPLLLTAVMEDTQPGEARDRLREARDKVEEVARGVNEGRRRWDVVKGVLEGKHPPPVRLKSIKSFRHRSGSKDEGDQLERLEKRLHECESFVHEFAKDVVDWTMSLRDSVTQLERWSTTFGRVIGLGQAHGSEALDLFTDIISSQILPVWISLDAAIQSTLLPKLARLLATTAQPLLLLSHMHALQPQHLQLLDAPMSKGRPPTSQMEASQSYLALDAQLRAELPRYIELLEHGFTACLGQFADWQGRFWKEVRAQWVELWDALGVEGDMNAGAADTVKVWWDRWEDVDATASSFNITKVRRDRSSRTSLRQSHSPGPTAALATAFVAGPSPVVSFPTSSSPHSSTSMPVLPPILPGQRRYSTQSIDLEIDMHVLSSTRASIGMTVSPEPYSPASSSASFRKESRRPSTSRMDSDRPSVSRRESESRWREGDRPSTARQEDERHRRPRVESDRQYSNGDRPSTARRDSERSAHGRKSADDRSQVGVLKKASADFALSSFHPLAPHSPSPRVSVHTTSSSTGSSNHRLSRQSFELGIDMHVGQQPGSSRASSASQAAQRPYGSPPVASISDLVSAAWMPVLPGTPSSISTTSSNNNIKDAQIVEKESRGRTTKKPSIRQRFTEAFRSPSMKRPSARVSAHSNSAPEIARSGRPSRELFCPSPAPNSAPEPISYPRVAMYSCAVIHPFSLPDHVLPLYRNLPFLVLNVGDSLEILSEEGHPSKHEGLSIRPEEEDSDDCLLIARDESGVVGWALASFLVILS